MTLMEIIVLSLGALLAENFVFARLLGIDPMMRASKGTSGALGLSAAVAAVMVTASALLWPVERLLLALKLPYMQTVTFMLVLSGLIPLIGFLLGRLAPTLKAGLGAAMPRIALNSAVLGIAMLSAREGLGFMDSVKAGLSAALGFTVAAVLFASIREKVDIRSDCPKAFEGLPIALVSAGLLALAFMGFQGLRV